MSDATRLRAAKPTSPTAASLVRVLASVVDLVATDHDPVADEPAVQRAVQAAASALVGLAESDPERTSDALDALEDVVWALAGGEAAIAVELWRQQAGSLLPALAAAHDIVGRLEALMSESTRHLEASGAAPAADLPVHGPWPREADVGEGADAPPGGSWFGEGHAGEDDDVPAQGPWLREGDTLPLVDDLTAMGPRRWPIPFPQPEGDLASGPPGSPPTAGLGLPLSRIPRRPRRAGARPDLVGGVSPGRQPVGEPDVSTGPSATPTDEPVEGDATPPQAATARDEMRLVGGQTAPQVGQTSEEGSDDGDPPGPEDRPAPPAPRPVTVPSPAEEPTHDDPPGPVPDTP